MNKDNLLKMAIHIENIPQKDFDMYSFRKDGSSLEMECNSVGCAVGHCSILDIDNIQKNFINLGGIQFSEWSVEFTGIDDEEWNYLFGDRWKYTDNTPKGTAKRIRYVVEYGFPKDMKQEIYGLKKLSYE